MRLNTKKKRVKKIGISEILILLVFFIGLCVLAYPTVSDLWNRYRNAQLISEYYQSLEGISHEEYERMFQEAEDYNRDHPVNNIVDAFDENEEYVLSHPYDFYLNPQGDGIMGYVTIPKIHVELAIYHGTGAETLEKGVGHVEGTSLPVGGSSTHAVIAGHRGLPSASLFTDLDQIEEGDLFFIHVLDQVLAYQVDQICTVKPEEVEALAIEDGKDYVTLLTCTPYGVNTHRLLVRGTRTEYHPEEDASESVVQVVLKDKRVLLLVMGLCLFVVILLLMLKGNKKKCSEEGEEDEK
ncbi:MAG: class C sortase [Hominisplanchenecus sp.]